MRSEGRAARVAVGASFTSMLLSANIAATLYAGYARRFGFSTAVLALVFAVYAIVLIPSLLLFGQISDQLGRRPVIALGLGLAEIALVLFATAQGAGSLFAARAVQGMAQGVLSGAATAALGELVAASDTRRAALLATLAQSGGCSLGVLLGGVLAQWAPYPHVLPFASGMATCLVAAALLRVVPETAPRNGKAFRIRRPDVPRAIRADFIRIGLTGAAVWSVAALYLSVIPSYAGRLVLHTRNLALLALVTSLVVVSSALAQLVVRRGAAPAPAQAIGLTLLALGLVALVVAAPLGSALLLIVAAAVAGVGHGVAVLAAQDALTHLAPDDQRAEVSAAFYVCIYAGVALPVIGVGVLAQVTTLYTALVVFAAVTGSAALTVAVWHLRAGHTIDLTDTDVHPRARGGSGAGERSSRGRGLSVAGERPDHTRG